MRRSGVRFISPAPSKSLGSLVNRAFRGGSRVISVVEQAASTHARDLRIIFCDPKNTFCRGNTIYYQRAIPTKLAGRCSVKHDLKTSDLTVAEKAVALLNRRYEAEWTGFVAAPESSPASLQAHADAFLKARGLTPNAPDNHLMAVQLLHDHIDSKREQHAAGDEHVYRTANPSDYLSPVEIEAGRRPAPLTLNDALELHLRIHPKTDDTTFTTYQRRAFAGLIAVTGDKAVSNFNRGDSRRYLGTSLASKVKTTTTRRLLGALSAVLRLTSRRTISRGLTPLRGLPWRMKGATRRGVFPSNGRSWSRSMQPASARTMTLGG